jgi:hypothetical protein
VSLKVNSKNASGKITVPFWLNSAVIYSIISVRYFEFRAISKAGPHPKENIKLPARPPEEEPRTYSLMSREVAKKTKQKALGIRSIYSLIKVSTGIIS